MIVVFSEKSTFGRQAEYRSVQNFFLLGPAELGMKITTGREKRGI
jgi:hypothetical protein